MFRLRTRHVFVAFVLLAPSVLAQGTGDADRHADRSGVSCGSFVIHPGVTSGLTEGNPQVAGALRSLTRNPCETKAPAKSFELSRL